MTFEFQFPDEVLYGVDRDMDNNEDMKEYLTSMASVLVTNSRYHCTKIMKFSMKDFFGKCDQIRSFLRIWSHLPKKSLMENFMFCALNTAT